MTAKDRTVPAGSQLVPAGSQPVPAGNQPAGSQPAPTRNQPGTAETQPGTGGEFWDVMGSRGPDTVTVGGVTVRSGSRVRLRPRGRSDIFDLALDGRIAIVEAVEQDGEGNVFLAVTVADDPGRDLGDARMPGHRFFYAPEEVRPLEPGAEGAAGARVLVAGIGNIFLGDDGFGCEVVRRLAAGADTAGADAAAGAAMPGVDIVEYGIRGMDLAYALLRDYRAAILVDASPRGYAPGTLTVIEPSAPSTGSVDLQTHGMDPVRVLALAREFGGSPARTYVVCCEPGFIPDTGADEEVVVGLSAPVRGALDAAVGMVKSLAAEILAESAGAFVAVPDLRGGPDGKGGEAREENAVVDRDRGGRGDARGGGPAVAGDPPVPEDAPDVGAPDVSAPDVSAPDVVVRRERSAVDVPGHSR
ncbi:hydrogenase maturation protease [Rugosimonospora africana]|uniref:Hydrogenase maturation protease n=1 Tax=Rugosimonospora africana TaxID=556532 RepID=A0A8J3VQ54_9ACTN|nr:hydrogenase maturation protease [Rugosimonospora africana]GIH14784.1 hypothetical protein Raf01_29560 [Rugosimonospora africana]